MIIKTVSPPHNLWNIKIFLNHEIVRYLSALYGLVKLCYV